MCLASGSLLPLRAAGAGVALAGGAMAEVLPEVATTEEALGATL